MIDEVGYLSYSNRHADLMFELVSRRYQNRSTLITTNRPFAEWREVFPNAACVVSLIDRLVHNAEIIAIEGESYRLKEARERTEQRARQRRGGKVMSTPPDAAAPCPRLLSRPRGRPSRRSPCSNCSMTCATGCGPSMAVTSRTCCNKNRGSPQQACNPTNRTATIPRSDPRRRRRRPQTRQSHPQILRRTATPQAPEPRPSSLNTGRHARSYAAERRPAAVYARFLTAADSGMLHSEP